MATDGLWDVFSSQDSVDFIKQRLTAEGIDMEALQKGMRIRINVSFIQDRLNGLKYLI
jgi:serine/threonine protein phosphatase PrpC